MLSSDSAKDQAHIDEEVSRLAITLSALQTQKNTFALISRLPTAILARIFVCYARDGYYRPYTVCWMPRFEVPRWVVVSHVSRHWRHVALTCPALWNHLFMVSSQWTEVLLARSLDSPLWVCVKSPGILGLMEVLGRMPDLELLHLENALRRGPLARPVNATRSSAYPHWPAFLLLHPCRRSYHFCLMSRFH